jgi:hypothetical protein
LLESLTPEQERQLERFREEWFRVGASCKPADRPLFEEAVANIYRQMGYGKPGVIWCGSPLSAVLEVRASWGFLGRPLLERIRGPCWVTYPDSIHVPLMVSLWESVFYRIDRDLRLHISFELRGSLIRSLGRFLGVVIERTLDTALGGCLPKAMWGCLEAFWIAQFIFMENCLGVKYEEESRRKLYWLADIARSAFWWWPFENRVVVSERPFFIRWDERRRVHAEGRPAVGFRDGWELYAWHGVGVPPEWGLTPRERWNPKWLLETTNLEQRRILMEAIGYGRIMEALGGKLIHRRAGMELREIEGVDEEPLRLLKVVCPSTGRTHVLRVPPHLDKCEAARRWTFGNERLKMVQEA